MFLTPESLDVEWVVDLVNEYSDSTRLAADEESDPYPAVGLNIREALPDIDLDAIDLVQSANDLFGVFAVLPDAEAVREALAGLLGQNGPRLVAIVDRTVKQAYLVPAGRNQVSMSGAITLLDHIANRGMARLGCCQARRCVDVFVDHSPARKRAFCSQTCQTRERVARYRRR